MGTAINRFKNVALALAALTLVGSLQPLGRTSALAQETCETFKETGKSVCGRFLEYWRQNGGLAQQGYPISGEFQEVSDLNGQAYTVQYFERAVFEKHPENQPPYDILLSQLGTVQFKKKYASKEPVSNPAISPQRSLGRYFAAMGFDPGNAIDIQEGLLSKKLRARLRRDDPYRGDPFWGILGQNFPRWKTSQYPPGTDLSGARPAWLLLLDDNGSTVAVFTFVLEDGEWKIDDVEPNVLK